MTNLIYLRDVVTLELCEEKCNGCGACATVCPHGVFTLEEGKARIAERDACMECGACALNCPEEAISVRSGVGCATKIVMAAVRGNRSKSCC